MRDTVSATGDLVSPLPWEDDSFTRAGWMLGLGAGYDKGCAP